jgi:lipocalin
MARTPAISDAEYDQLVEKITGWGYDTEKLERVPQRW